MTAAAPAAFYDEPHFTATATGTVTYTGMDPTKAKERAMRELGRGLEGVTDRKAKVVGFDGDSHEIQVTFTLRFDGEDEEAAQRFFRQAVEDRDLILS